MSNKIELLAPAGDFDSLRAAVENGADAVYLGGKLFNARQFAGNFDLEALTEAINYAHIRGVNIYLTMNTLISDSEIKDAVKFAVEAYLAGIDGIIVQDAGFASIIRKELPDLPLHGSTQMTVHNLEGVRLLEKAGFTRVVLARELGLDEIRQISAGTGLEVEIFIHGALCICYSGQCLMSSMIGGRSGNRGKCAQPCRLPYTLVDDISGGGNKGSGTPRYLLSPKDLCTLPQIDEIAASGVKSLKIEGRMKSPEYVATVVRIYRKYLDIVKEQDDKGQKLRPEENDMRQLLQIFNRGGFTGGYIGGQRGQDLMCYEKPKNWGTYLGEVLSYNHKEGTVQVRLAGSLAMGDGVEIWNGENENPGNIVTLIRIKGKNVKEAAKGEIVDIGTIRGRISKGCKVYKTSEKALLDAAGESFRGKPARRVPLYGEAILKEDAPLFLKVRDKDGNESEAYGSIYPEKAINRPLTEERLKEQLSKTGATPFEFISLEIKLEAGLSLPVSEINEVRRKALDLLEQKRIRKYDRHADISRIRENIALGLKKENRPLVLRKQENRPQVPAGMPKIALYFHEWNQYAYYDAFSADRLYLPFRAVLKAESIERIKAIRQKGTEVFIWTPAIIRGNYLSLLREKAGSRLIEVIDGILAGSPAVIEILKGYAEGLRKIKLFGDHSFNVFNTYTAFEFKAMGFEGLTLSPELNLGQITEICGNVEGELESIAYGRLPLMTSEYCPVGSVKGGYSSGKSCEGCCSKGSFRLRDRMGAEFPLICDRIDCRSTILNSNVLFIPETLHKLRAAGISAFRLNIWNESPDRINELVKLHREMAEKPEANDYRELIDRIKSEGFTKGHYYKGV